jgi:mannose-6-phosphate isomerase-like protein (cupin superfamily)
VKLAWQEIIARIPGPPVADWPEGVPFAEVLRHGSMSMEVFAPCGPDRQSPHEQDELYPIKTGHADFLLEECRHAVGPGDLLFVPARAQHRFERMSADFVTWVVFWGPVGGEA